MRKQQSLSATNQQKLELMAMLCSYVARQDGAPSSNRGPKNVPFSPMACGHRSSRRGSHGSGKSRTVKVGVEKATRAKETDRARGQASRESWFDKSLLIRRNADDLNRRIKSCPWDPGGRT